MKNILVAVTGGISAYKAVDVISALKKQGHRVSAMATDSALQFVSENVLKITADRYWKHSWDAPIHINATEPDMIDVFVIVPATANIMAKIRYGIADDLVSSTVLALPPNTLKMIFPAMNSRMWNNDVVQGNWNDLKLRGWEGLNPVSGMLACGTEGIGKLPSTKDIVENIKECIRVKDTYAGLIDR
jgi:phosphopantothenoylcysteine synthetase/decarboxylase